MEMAQRSRGPQKLEVLCPCCGATLTVDAQLGKVIFHQAAAKDERGPDLDDAAAMLRKEAERREAIFRQSADDQKVQSELLERKFKEAFAKTKDQPTTRPMRDIDLD